MNTIQYSLFENRMQSIMTDIVCLALENRPHLIKNQVETSLDDFKINDQIICKSESKIDYFGRTVFHLNLNSKDSKYIAKLELYFDGNGVYKEGSFEMLDQEYSDSNLINILQLHKLDIAKNIFKYPKI